MKIVKIIDLRYIDPIYFIHMSVNALALMSGHMQRKHIGVP